MEFVVCANHVSKFIQLLSPICLRNIYKNRLEIVSRRRFCFQQSCQPRHLNNEENESGKRPHKPVMVKEVLEMLNPSDNQVFVDMTFGAGGHSEQILKSADNLTILAVDRDPVAIGYARNLAEKYKGSVVPMQGKFSQLESMFNQCGIEKNSVDGVLLDVGASSMQMDDPSRGFALSTDGPLDMRMGSSRIGNQPTARQIVNSLDADTLTKIFKVYGDEKAARPIAEAIVAARYQLMEINTTQELATLVENVLERYSRYDKLGRTSHVATKTFQALRIFVNDELNELDCGLELAYDYLKPGGRLVAVCFHSLEDRIVKRHILGVDVNETICSSITQRHKSAGMSFDRQEVEAVYSKRWKPINKRIVLPSEEEVEQNPRARSARLRAAIKV